MGLYLIIILSLCLRLINIDKPEGLWNDEYVSWYVASTPFFKGFWQEVLKQCHLPLYYLYLKPFAHCNDIVLRLTSLLPAVLSVPVMYLVGKEYSKEIAVKTALTTAVLSFLVYYSQEVRFYSLLFLFSALLLLFTIRLINNKKTMAGFVISSLLVLFTHVLGIIYVFFNTCYVMYKKKRLPIAILIVSFLILLPLGINILKMLPASQWWGHFTYTNILFLFSDFFSPILTNNVNAPSVFFYNTNPFWCTLILLPTLIAVWGIAVGSKKNRGLAAVSLATVFVMCLFALSGKLVFITKYLTEILPALILLMTIGLNGKIGKWLFVLFISFHLFAVFTPFYTAKILRSEGHRIVGEILNKQNPDKIIFTYYDDLRFRRYLKIDVPTYYISKINRFDYSNPSDVLCDVKVGERVSVVFLDSVSFLTPEFIESIDDRKIPEMFITFSNIKNALVDKLAEDYKDFRVDKDGSWTVVSAARFK